MPTVLGWSGRLGNCCFRARIVAKACGCSKAGCTWDEVITAVSQFTGPQFGTLPVPNEKNITAQEALPPPGARVPAPDEHQGRSPSCSEPPPQGPPAPVRIGVSLEEALPPAPQARL